MKTDANLSLQSSAETRGIKIKWTDINGREHKISSTALESVMKALGMFDGKQIEPVAEPANQKGRRVRSVDDGQARRLSVRPILPDACVFKRGWGDTSVLPIEVRFQWQEVDLSKADLQVTFSIYEEYGAVRTGMAEPLEGESGAFRIAIGSEVGWGYHRLKITLQTPAVPGNKTNGSHSQQLEWEIPLIITPAQCYLPGSFSLNQKIWGPSINLTTLKSKRNWGSGDFSDLKNVISFCTAQGAGIAAVSSLHAQLAYAGKSSPRLPSHRGFISVLYIDVEAVEDFRQCEEARRLVASPEFQKALDELRQADVVDVRGVLELKLRILDKLYQYFRSHHLHRPSNRTKDFRAFQRQRGKELRYFAAHQAIAESLLREGSQFESWLAWPEKYKDPDSQAVLDFIASNNERIEFFEYLQWQAEIQLNAVGSMCLNSRLPLGLVLDVSPLCSYLGAEAWRHPDVFAEGLSLVEPPRPYLLDGYITEAPPFSLRGLRRAAYQPLSEILRHNMRHAGAIRMRGVFHWLSPVVTADDTTLDNSAIVSMPVEEILGIIALESHRNFSMVIMYYEEITGNDSENLLSTLRSWNIVPQQHLLNNEPEKIESRLAGREPFEHRLLEPLPPSLSPLSAFWQGSDLQALAERHLPPDREVRDRLIDLRVQQRMEILHSLESRGLLPEGVTPDPLSVPIATPSLLASIMTLMARSSASIVLFRLEDLVPSDHSVVSYEDVDQPNWRIKLTPSFDLLIESDVAELVVDRLQSERGSFFDHLELAPLAEVPAGKKLTIPQATYRLQLSKQFNLTDVEKLVDYLHNLGISHLYLSPILEARPGSPHGYDIINHKRLNPELGTEADLSKLSDHLRSCGMGIVLDLVPNHMGIGKHNPWWTDVLEHGPASEYADYFDIDWCPVKKELHGRVLLPILGDAYGRVIRDGQLKFAFDKETGKFNVSYYEHELPLNPVSYPLILGRRISVLNERLGSGNMLAMDYMSIAEALSSLPNGMGLTNDQREKRLREFKVSCHRLVELCARSPVVLEFIEQNLKDFEASDKDAAAVERVHDLLEMQSYRLAFWRVAAHEINYRRFFDINDLAGVRVEDQRAFIDMHEYVFKLLEERKIDGLRIDHPDGLFDPSGYFRRIQEEAERRLRAANETFNDTPSRFERQQDYAIYLLGEKILAPYERMERDWLIHGTTGYDFLNAVNGLLVDDGEESVFNEFYQICCGETESYDELIYKSKHLIMQTSLSSELNVLAHRLTQIAESNWMYRDFTLNSLRHALSEVVAFFPVYRTYVKEGTVSDVAISYIGRAIRRAKQHNRTVHPAIFDFIRDVLTLKLIDGIPSIEEKAGFEKDVVSFAMKFQQFTGPVMAKSLEDTLFYKYNRFVCLNEVGAEPNHFGLTTSDFHFLNEERHRHYPYSMLATSTHDTKRSEDVRARLTVLSEIPDNWQERVLRWMDYNEARYVYEADRKIPTSNDEYLFYQTLVGTYPLDLAGDQDLDLYRQRIEQYMLKACREAKENTSWINPDQTYEDGLVSFIRSLLRPENLGAKADPFFVDFLEFHEHVCRLGLIKALVQALLKFTCPGVPDIYQGNELFDFSLVDPDNRRPVDFNLRHDLLNGMRPFIENMEERSDDEKKKFIRELLQKYKDGRIKLYLTAKMLHLRAGSPKLFTIGRYLPIGITGEGKDCFISFARERHGETAVVVAPVLVSPLITPDFASLYRGPEETAYWMNTRLSLPRELQKRNYINALSGEKVEFEDRRPRISSVLQRLPFALLVSG